MRWLRQALRRLREGLPLLIALAALLLGLGLRRVPSQARGARGEASLAPGVHLRGFTAWPTEGLLLLGHDAPPLKVTLGGRPVEIRALVAWRLKGEAPGLSPERLAERITEALTASLSRGDLEGAWRASAPGLELKVDLISATSTLIDEAALLSTARGELEAALRAATAARVEAAREMEAAAARGEEASAAARAAWAARALALETETEAAIAEEALEGARWRATRRAEAAAYALEREAEGALIEAELWALEQRAMGAVLRGAGASRYLALEAAARLEAAGMGGTATGPLSLDEWRRRLGRPPRPSAD